MQSPGHSLAELMTSSRRSDGTSARCAGRGEQVAGVVLHVGEPVDVELEDLGRVLDAQAVAGAQILVDPDLQVLAHPMLVLRCLESRLSVMLQQLHPSVSPDANCRPGTVRSV